MKQFLIGMLVLLVLAGCEGRVIQPSSASESSDTFPESSISSASSSTRSPANPSSDKMDTPSSPVLTESSSDASLSSSLAQPISSAESSQATAPSSSQPESASAQTPSSAPTSELSFIEADFPTLVNADHPLPEGFQPDAIRDNSLPYPFSAKGMPALKAMIAQAAKDGIQLTLISGYRSIESQTRNFNAKKQEYLNNGKTEQEAIAATALYIAYPGTSEHNLGLAADLNSLYESFEQTAEFAWLSKHAASYGFVLRYPKDKVGITGIAYEPWHYRYVGSNHAELMNAEGLCLEEYVEIYGG